jgi:hypothetical protein
LIPNERGLLTGGLAARGGPSVPLPHPLLGLGRDVRRRRPRAHLPPRQPAGATAALNSSVFTWMGAPVTTARFTASLGRASTSRGPVGPSTSTTA